MKKIAFFVTSEKQIKSVNMLKQHIDFADVVALTGRQEFVTENVLGIKEINIVKPDLLVMFMAYPNPDVLMLEKYALLNNIPTLAIQEVNQLSLNKSRVNHYFTPVDRILAISELEKDLLKKSDVFAKENIEIVGWCFSEKSKVLIDEVGEKTVTLFLSPLNTMDAVSLETQELREDYIKKSSKFAKKYGYNLNIRPHPMERDLSSLQQMLDNLQVKANILAGDLNIDNLMHNTDIVINKGNSQVILEALKYNKTLLLLEKNHLILSNDFYIGNYSQKKDLRENYDKILLKHFGEEKDSLNRVLVELKKGLYLKKYSKRVARHLALLFIIKKDLASFEEIKHLLSQQDLELLNKLQQLNLKAAKKLWKLYKNDSLVCNYVSKIIYDRMSVFKWQLKTKNLNYNPYFWRYKPLTIKILNKLKAAYKLYNRVSNIDTLFRKKALDSHYLVLPVTYRCNLSCVMCTCPQQAKEMGELDLLNMQNKLRHLSKDKTLPIENINLTGGELFLRKDLDQIVALLKDYGVKQIGISGNCYNQKQTVDGFTSLLKSYPEIQWGYMTSIDGDEETHNSVRRNKKAFANTIATLKELKKLQKKYTFALSVGVTVSPENIDTVKSVEAIVKDELGIPMGYTYAVDSDLYINSQESKVSGDLNSKEYIKKVQEFALNDYKENSNLFALDVYHMLNGKYRFSPCAFHYGGNFLEPSGKFFKCSITSKSYLPDLEEKTQKKVLAGIRRECGSCLNNCGNFIYSRGIVDYLQSAALKNKKIFLATDKKDIFTKMALKHLKISFEEYKGEEINGDSFVIFTHRTKYFTKLKDDGLTSIKVKVGLV